MILANNMKTFLKFFIQNIPDYLKLIIFICSIILLGLFFISEDISMVNSPFGIGLILILFFFLKLFAFFFLKALNIAGKDHVCSYDDDLAEVVVSAIISFILFFSLIILFIFC